MRQLIHTLAITALHPLLFAAAPGGGETILLHTNENGVAVSGYDAVAFFEEGEPVKGRVEHRTVHKGALYYFVSADNLETFRARPQKFEPRFGGFCPVSLAEDKPAPGNPDNFRIVNGQLYLLHDSDAARRFNEQHIALVEKQWDHYREKHGDIHMPEGFEITE